MLVPGVPGPQVLPNSHIWTKMVPTKPLAKMRKAKVVEMKAQNLILKIEAKAPAMKLASLSVAMIPVVSARSYFSPNDSSLGRYHN